MTHHLLGLDPDSDRSGIAILDPKTNTLDLKLMRFFELMDYLQANKPYIIKVYIEAGWLNKKTNWHGGGSKGVSDRIAHGVGRNHQTGILICEGLECLEIPHELVRPTTRKWSQKEFTMYTGAVCKNQEKIDATSMVWGRTK